ncbi:acyl carrier protein [Streptomyces turgidiscabies]|uniref:Acyl carrier protein n=1 Tax=Streptomyces turgidiscabies TaxID=85558 RepID=A0ABU0RTR3_9ACTN|nr:phosphopantetheine-binding protein [Streptomyces turgidiscabies]MDQ0935379.1 acyl carrier protein [Streptomyces turgidiscabies]
MSVETIDAQLEGIVREHCPDLEPHAHIDPDDSLKDLGLNSVGTIGILVAVEQAFSVSLSDEDLSVETFKSIRSLRLTVLKYLG